MRAPTLTVIIPAYNEEASLAAFLPAAVDHCRAHDYDLVVVNDGSRDRTGAILDEADRQGQLRALHHKMNRGYGAAIKTGVMAAETDFLVTIDADAQHDLADIDRLFAKGCEEDADMVVGSRRGQVPASRYRSTGKMAIRSFARLLMPVPIEDINSGMKLYRTDLARRYLPLCPDSMAFSDIILLTFLHNGHQVLEQPIHVHARAGGKSTISTATAFETILEILHILVLFNPMRIFLPASVLCLCFGFAWGLPIILDRRGVSVGAMLAIVTGLIFFFLGLIAEQLSWIRRALFELERRDELRRFSADGRGSDPSASTTSTLARNRPDTATRRR
jgi:glycosyltransferase involved in cell wall biosynthesis